MKTPVNFEIAKLLKEKGFNELQAVGNQPTIADVVMWLYETHDIWIMIDMTGSKKFYPRGRMIDKKGKHHVGDFKYNSERLIYTSPIEAYEAAINYCLINLI